MDKFKLIDIFADTAEHSKDMLISTTSKYTFRDIIKVEKPTDFFDNISVINSDSVSALVEYSKKGKTCVLNMASYKHPGGGVERGARAQEECLFRCSNLYHVISKNFYPLIENQCLYTSDAVFFKDVNYNYMDSIVADVVTIAALNLNTEHYAYGNNVDEEYYEKTTKNKIILMLSLAIKNKIDNIILGAWGCGVFKNDPEKMSNYFYDILLREGYANYFSNVVFAIINDHNSVANNYIIFKNKFE